MKKDTGRRERGERSTTRGFKDKRGGETTRRREEESTERITSGKKKIQEVKTEAKATTHLRRHIHPHNNCSSARKRDIQLFRIKQGRIAKVGRRNVEFIFNELGGCGGEWEEA